MKNDVTAQTLIQQLTIDPTSIPHYQLQKGILRYKNMIYVGKNGDLPTKVFRALDYSSALGGHSGNNGTTKRIISNFF